MVTADNGAVAAAEPVPEPRLDGPLLISWVVILVSLHLATIVAHVTLDQFFWQPRPTLAAVVPGPLPIFAKWAAVLAVALAAIVFLLASIGPKAPASYFSFVRTMGLIACAFAFQLAIVAMDGGGIQTLRVLMKASGHAAFGRAAFHQPKILPVLSHYEELAESGKLGVFAISKPPGVFLFYWVSNEAAKAFGPPLPPGADDDSQMDRLTRFCVIVWAAMAALAVWPLLGLGRVLAGTRTALHSAALFVAVPTLSLIPVHTDQALFPALALFCLWSGAAAAVRRSVWLAAASGIIVGLSFLFQFPFVTFLGVIGLMFLCSGSSWRRRALLTAVMVVGFVTVVALFQWTFGYHFISAFRKAVEYSYQWQHKDVAPMTVAQHLLNLLNILAQVTAGNGTVVEVLAVVTVFLALRAFWRRSAGPLEAFAIGIAGLFVVFGLHGDFILEARRLLFFLAPPFCFLAACALRYVSSTSARVLWPLAFWLQVSTVLLVRMCWCWFVF